MNGRSNISRHVHSLALVASIAFVAGAANASSYFAGDFLAIGIGPRAIGMGGAATAIAQGADATCWNPAALASERSPAFSFEHAERFAGIVVHDALAATMPLERGSLGLVLFRGAIDDIVYADSTILPDPTRPPGADNIPDASKVSWFSNTDYVFHVAYGRPVWRGIELGGAVKLVRRTIDDTGAFGYGLDFGARWSYANRVAVGMLLRDISTTRVAWDNGRTDIVEPTVHLGTAYRANVPGNGRLTLAAGTILGSVQSGYGGHWRVGAENNPGTIGAEYAWNETIMLRAGTRDLRGLVGPGSGEISAGVGLSTRLPWVPSVRRVGLDVAWTRHTLRDSYRIGANFEL